MVNEHPERQVIRRLARAVSFRGEPRVVQSGFCFMRQLLRVKWLPPICPQPIPLLA